MAQEQFLQTDQIFLARHGEPQRAGTEPADGSRGHLDGPDPLCIEAKFRMHGAVRQSQGVDGAEKRLLDGALLDCAQPRRRHVNRFFEVRPFERVGLIEDGQDAQHTFGQQPFNGHFRAFEIALHQHLVEMRFAGGANFRRVQQTLQPRRAGEELFAIVYTHDALAGGKRNGLKHAGITNAKQ